MKPLSFDLRKRIIAAVDDGIAINVVARQFNVCKRTIYNWLKLRAQTSVLTPKVGYQRGHSHKIKDRDKFVTFVEENKGKSLKAMAAEWEKQHNESIAASTIGAMLAKIGYTFKKKRLIIGNLTRKSESSFWKR